MQVRGRGGKNHRRTPSIESEGTPDALPMSLEKAIEEIAGTQGTHFYIGLHFLIGSGTTSPMVSDTSISPERSDATPPTYGAIFDLELEDKGAADLHLSLHSRSSDTEDGFPHPPHSPTTATTPKKKGDSQAMSLPIDIPIRDKPSQPTEMATQSQSTGSDTYLNRSRLSREVARVRANADNKFQPK